VVHGNDARKAAALPPPVTTRFEVIDDAAPPV